MDIYSTRNTPPGFYVYAYLRDDGTPYYIGKGKDDRAWKKSQNHSPPKNKLKIIIMECNLTEIGSLALERFYIRWYGRKNIGTGILRNLTDGGDGVSGYKRTQSNRKKISEIRKKLMLLDEEKEKLSIAQKRLWKDPNSIFNSKEHRKKISESGSIARKRMWSDPNSPYRTKEYREKQSRIQKESYLKRKMESLNNE